MATPEDQLRSTLKQHAVDGKITTDQLNEIMKALDPGNWTDENLKALADAVCAENGLVPVENLVSRYFLQEKVAKLTAELDALSKLSKQGGVGFEEAIAANASKPGLQGLVIKVNHVSRICLDAEKSREFYMDILGASMLNRPNFPSPGYWLWLGNVQLHLIQGKHAREEAMHASGIPTGNVNHYSFEVWDFDACEAKLRKIKYPFKKNRVPEGGNVIHQLFLQDPDGHYIEICDCNKFTDFVFGPPPDPSDSKKLAVGYNEGIDPTAASISAVTALAFLPGKMEAGSQEELDESVAMLQRAFKVFSQGDDFIETKDLEKIMKRMGHNISEEQLKEMVTEADHDGSGHIGFREFVNFMGPRLKPDHNKDELQAAFDTIDTDGSGCINADELLLMLWGIGQRVNEEELVGAIKRADKNGDGTVNFHEFLELFGGLKRGVGS
eukprot:TRINITY_DN25418_c0_g1_i1.p1 TRINITY_DN25418_c0_g1~~TRINITY_DN25418_c0_g1_i1.p1  ORF type:complete len:440 (-),score=91.35 TRINITY_DN25418_c0_g1_i1:107-1426(-)